jgi:dihydroxy-acid dehydratase
LLPCIFWGSGADIPEPSLRRYYWNIPRDSYYAGGVPAIMEEIKDYLHLDVMTVTGRTLGENLEELKANGFYEKCNKWLDDCNSRYNIKITKEDIIRPYDNPIGRERN